MDVFQTIGAILAFSLLVFQLFDRIPAARRFVTNSIQRIKGVGQMFRDLRLWITYHPTYEVIADYAVVTQDYCHIKLPIKIKYTSRDDRFDTEIICERVLIDMYHCGKRDKTPYRLYVPGKYQDRISLPPGKSMVLVESVALKDLKIPAELNSIIECKVIAVGSAKIYGMSSDRNLKPKKFNVRVRIQ